MEPIIITPEVEQRIAEIRAAGQSVEYLIIKRTLVRYAGGVMLPIELPEIRMEVPQ